MFQPYNTFAEGREHQFTSWKRFEPVGTKLKPVGTKFEPDVTSLNPFEPVVNKLEPVGTTSNTADPLPVT